MENKESYLELISSENYKHQLDIWFRAYNISHEKTNLFYDFLISLYELIENTYLGDDVIKTESEQHNHFIWCWDKTIENFEKEKIFLQRTGSHMEYFWNFFLEAYYFAKIDGNSIKINEYFYRVFDFKHRKTRSELDILSEIYRLLNQNLKN